MIDEIVEFVKARLADDEQAATQCKKRDWQFSGSNCQVIAEQENGSFRTIAWCANGYDDDLSNSIHIAAFDPARVLRDVQSKRAMLRFLDPTGAPEGEGRYVAERTLLLLAMAWSSHPDYDPRWADVDA